MGKTYKGKAKVKAKIDKAKRKIARKVKGKEVVATALTLLSVYFLCGCATSDSMQPAKSQTQNNTFDDCIIVVAMNASISNRVVSANGTKEAPAVELFTQAQSLETTGSTENYTPTANQTPTTDVRPDIDANYNGPTKAGGDALTALISGLTPAAAELLKQKQAEKYTGTLTLDKTDGTTATVECKDGVCTACTDVK